MLDGVIDHLNKQTRRFMHESQLISNTLAVVNSDKFGE